MATYLLLVFILLLPGPCLPSATTSSPRATTECRWATLMNKADLVERLTLHMCVVSYRPALVMTLIVAALYISNWARRSLNPKLRSCEPQIEDLSVAYRACAGLQAVDRVQSQHRAGEIMGWRRSVRQVDPGQQLDLHGRAYEGHRRTVDLAGAPANLDSRAHEPLPLAPFRSNPQYAMSALNPREGRRMASDLSSPGRPLQLLREEFQRRIALVGCRRCVERYRSTLSVAWPSASPWYLDPAHRLS